MYESDTTKTTEKPNKIIIKFNDSLGFIGVEKNKIDSGEFISDEDFKNVFGFTLEELDALSGGDHVTEESIKLLSDAGYVEVDEEWRSNGDVHAHVFKLKK